jgi:PleD family two-component response regulator
MKRHIPTSTALAFSLALVAPVAHACGEGQFNMGHGLRYQGYLARHPATVLVYDDGTVDRKPLYAGLQKAGHKVTVVGTADAMAQALHARRFDVVIADLDDATSMQSLVVATSAKTKFLPVVSRNRRDAPELRNQFKLFLLDGASLGQYLKVINQSLSLRIP